MPRTSIAMFDWLESRFRKRAYARVKLYIDGSYQAIPPERILSVETEKDVDPLSRKLPEEKLSFTVLDLDGEYDPANPDGIWEKLDENTLVTVEFGFELTATTGWMHGGEFVLDGKPSLSEGKASFTASGRIGRLNGIYYKGVYEEQTLYDMAEAVFEDAGITGTYYYIDDCLEDYTTDAPLPIDTHCNLLQMIAHAGGCALFMVGDVYHIERIDFEGADYSTDYINRDVDILLNGDILSKNAPLYKVMENLYHYVPDEDRTELYRATVTVDGLLRNYHCEFDAATEITVNAYSESGGADIGVRQIYASALDCTVVGFGEVTIVVRGQKLSATTDTAELIVSNDTSGGVDEEDNPLITTDDHRAEHMQLTADYLSLRSTHTLMYRGNPSIQPMDTLYVESPRGTVIGGLVLMSRITFDGTLGGSLIVKVLDEDERNSALLYDKNDDAVANNMGAEIACVGLTDYTSSYSYTEIDDFISEVLDDGS